MNGPCPFPCTNKNEFGYCKTTACLYAPTIRVTSTPRTHADRIRAKTDEELAEWIISIEPTACPYAMWGYNDDCNKTDCRQCWLDWLRQEADG